MSYLVGNPEDRFSHNEAHLDTRSVIRSRQRWTKVLMRCLRCPDWLVTFVVCICWIRFSHDVTHFFGLMLYVHGKQLRSYRDGQLSYPHCSWASLPEAGFQYLAHIISPLTDKCSSLISGRGRMAVEIFSWPNLHEKMCRTRGSIAMPLDSQAISLPTRLTHFFEHTYRYEPRCEKTGLRGFRPGPTQTGLSTSTEDG